MTSDPHMSEYLCCVCAKNNKRIFVNKDADCKVCNTKQCSNCES